jgi:hypothetical protein
MFFYVSQDADLPDGEETESKTPEEKPQEPVEKVGNEALLLCYYITVTQGSYDP